MDPIAFELFKNAIFSIADEMALTVFRTTYSGVLKDNMDYSTGFADAEGRLVLADVLWYCQDRFKPKLMIDLATLTGAVIVALGHEHAAVFANNDELAERLIASGAAVGEKLWRLPLDDRYDRAIDSDAADVKNIAADRAAGSIIGAQFVQRFVNKVPWAHLDIAGVAWSKKDAPTVPKGATGFGVRLLDRFVADHYEKD